MRRVGVLLAVAMTCVAFSATATATDRTVVVVMIDGFPARLLDKAQTPTFDRLLAQSVWSDRLVPAFPSVSHTNWVSLSTGCWPERHGIVSNQFEIEGRAADRDTIIDADTMLECQPIHDVAEAQGVRSAALGWTGSESSSRGPLASVVKPYFDTWDSARDVERAGQIVEQLDRDDSERPRLLLAYFNGPDTVQHYTGMESKETKEAIENTDKGLGILLRRLEALAPEREVSLFVVTDHGMVTSDGLLNAAKILDNAGIEARVIADGPLAFIYMEDPSQREVAAKRLRGNAHFDVVLPERQPAHWRLGTSPRVGDMMLYAKRRWFFPMDDDMPSWLPRYSRWGPEAIRVPAWLRRIGMHGYAIEDEPKMGGLFLAWGSGIGPPRKFDTPVRAVDLHPTVTRLLEIEPGSPLDGRLLEDILAPDV